MGWITDAVSQVPQLQDYPLKAKDFDEDMINSDYYWRKGQREVEIKMQNEAKKAYRAPQAEKVVVDAEQIPGRNRRCFSCSQLKPEYSYNKNERKKGVEARCISCVATNPAALDLATICPVCKIPKLDANDTVCKPCMARMASESKKPSQ